MTTDPTRAAMQAALDAIERTLDAFTADGLEADYPSEGAALDRAVEGLRAALADAPEPQPFSAFCGGCDSPMACRAHGGCIIEGEHRDWLKVAAGEARPEPVAEVRDGVLVRSSLPVGYTGPLYAAAPPQPAVDRDAVLLDVIRRLNANPYNMTKAECIAEVQAMRTQAPDAPPQPAEPSEEQVEAAWQVLFGNTLNAEEGKRVRAALVAALAVGRGEG